MTAMTAEELLAEAAKCVRCKAVHPERLARAHPVRPDLMRTTAAVDGHPYSPMIGPKTMERLRELIPVAEPAGHEPVGMASAGPAETGAARTARAKPGVPGRKRTAGVTAAG
jgi:hypothetical protein